MKYSKAANRFLLLLVPFLFTGCYTQFQTFDRYPLEEDRYAGYSAWDGFEERQTSDEAMASNPYYNSGDEEYLDEELALEEAEIYYIDYETERWYKEHYANKMFWEGYSIGYNDGFYDGASTYFPNSRWYNFNRYRYAYGYNGAFGYYNPRYQTLLWVSYGGFSHYGYYTCYYRSWRCYTPYYDGFWGSPYYTHVSIYNNYYKAYKYRRSADIYRKGPRSRGFLNGSDYRTRTGNGVTRTRGAGLTRTRGTNTGVRVRGNSSGKGSSVGRSSGTRTRGSSVGNGKSRSGSSKGRSRGSSVGKGSSGKSSSGSRGSGTRKRGNNESASLTGTSVRTIDVSGFGNRTYTIPSRTVGSRSLSQSSSRSSGFGSFLKKTFFGPGSTVSVGSAKNSRTRGISSGSSSTRIKTRSSGKSSGSKVSRSSSSSRSSGTRSRSSSSSSSKKRSRGSN